MSASSTFEELGIETWLVNQCQSLSMHQPTPIQIQCIPAILAGRNIVGGAATGSGKTAAFALPMLQFLSKDLYGISGLILTASRELAYQLTDQFIALGAPLRIRTVLAIGGITHNDQVEGIKSRPHFLFATPGRLAYLFRTFEAEVSAALRYLKFLVLDEADRLTEAELGADVKWLLTHHLKPTPRRQVLLFSATLHPRLTKRGSLEPSPPEKKRRTEQGAAAAETDLDELPWATLLLGDVDSPQCKSSTSTSSSSFFVAAVGTGTEGLSSESPPALSSSSEATDPSIHESFSIPTTLSNQYLFIPNMVKLPYLVATLRSFGKDQSSIVFVNSCMRTELVHLVLQLLGFPVCRLHSLLRQQQRLDSLALFKLGIAKVLVATDIASRGLDIPEVTTVIHYDMPKEVPSFVHRVGRTARAGREGRSIAIVTECDVRLVKKIESKLHTKLVAWVKEQGGAPDSSSSSTKKIKRGKKDAQGKSVPGVAEEDVVKILDEVSEAKVTALQQVKETFSMRASTLKEQAAEKKASRPKPLPGSTTGIVKREEKEKGEVASTKKETGIKARKNEAVDEDKGAKAATKKKKKVKVGKKELSQKRKRSSK